MNFVFENRGQALIHTNYWDNEHATKKGFVFLIWNAGAARLLIPDLAKPLLRDMRGAHEVIIIGLR